MDVCFETLLDFQPSNLHASGIALWQGVPTSGTLGTPLLLVIFIHLPLCRECRSRRSEGSMRESLGMC